MPSSRRALLTGVGAALTGLAGCLDTSGDGPSTTPTSTPTGTPASPALTDAALGDSVTVDGVTLTVSDATDAHSIRYLTAPDAFGVLGAAAGADSDQFVLVRVSAAGGDDPPAPEHFSLVADGTGYDAGIEGVGPARVDAPVSGRPYGGSTRRGYLGFRIPAPLDAADVAVVFADAARWSLPDAVVDGLQSPPPAFETTLSVPDAVAADEAISVRIDVTNEGEGVATFHGAINHQGPLYAADSFSVSLPPGESTTHEATVGYYRGSDSPPARVQFGVVGPGVSESFSVRIEGGGTPSGTETVA
jgi:hypothetical protein